MAFAQGQPDDALSGKEEPEPSPRPHEADGDPAWRVTLYAVWVAQLMSIIGFSFVMPFLPFYIHELGVTDARQVAIWAGLLGTAGGVTMTAAAPLWGMLADHYGRKPMVMRSMLGGAVIMGAMGLAGNVYHLLALRLLQGMVTGTVGASVALISSVTPRRHMGYSLGLMQMAVFTGAALGPWLGGSLADRFGYRVPFVVTAGLLLCGGLLVAFATRERFERPPAARGADHNTLRTLVALPGVTTLLLVYFMLNLSGTIVAPIFPLFVADLLGTHEGAASTTGAILAISGIVAAVAAVTIGRVSDRVGHRRILVGAVALAALLSFPQAAARAVWQLLLLRALYGIAAGGMGPTTNALVATLVPRQRLGSIYGMTGSATSLGHALGPSIGGALAAGAGLRAPFVLMGAMLLALAGLVRWRVAAPNGPPQNAENPPA